MGKLVILRHGQTFGNIHGHINTKEADPFNFLSPAGINQALDVQLFDKFDLYLVSEFNRSKQTMMLILFRHKLLASEELANLGIISNINEWSAGETQDDVWKRAVAFMNTLGDLLKEKNVLAVSHGLYMRFIFNMLRREIPLTPTGEALHCTPYEITHDDVLIALGRMK